MDCDCNNYSLLTANTGIATISVANPSLDGSGTTVSVITAAANGTIVRSVTIKAIAPVRDGMVRLFIKRPNGPSSFIINLYEEIAITVAPRAAIVPIPAPQYAMFETILVGDLKLKSGEELVASTQNADTFNIIAEGVDWTYPVTTPDVCCNFEQIAAATGNGSVSTANTALDGSGTIENIFTADPDANGAIIRSIAIKALQSTHQGMVRLFISPDGSTWSLMREVWIPQTMQSSYKPSFNRVEVMDFKLEAGYSIGASTQNAEGFAINIEALDWTYPVTTEILSRTVTIDHTQCGGSDSTDFPVLVSIQDDTLKTATHGGHVANANGYDIMFFSDSGETTLLNWEVEFYDGTTGTLIAWVLIPTVSHTTDTVFYMQYGDSSITTFQGGAVGAAWNSDYVCVYHFANGTALSAVDATGNAHNGTITSATAATGQIDGAAAFSSASIAMGSSSAFNLGTGDFTFSCWYNTSFGSNEVAVGRFSGSGDYYWLGAASGNAYFEMNTPTDSCTGTTIDDGNWHYITITRTSGALALYVDNISPVSGTGSASSAPAGNLVVGDFGDAGGYPWAGSIDEVRMSDVARTADWITTEYNNQSNPGNIGVAGFITYGNET